MQSILWAATGTGFTFLMTTLGAAMVFLFRKQLNASIQRIFLGFAAGVMIAAKRNKKYWQPMFFPEYY